VIDPSSLPPPLPPSVSELRCLILVRSCLGLGIRRLGRRLDSQRESFMLRPQRVNNLNKCCEHDGLDVALTSWEVHLLRSISCLTGLLMLALVTVLPVCTVCWCLWSPQQQAQQQQQAQHSVELDGRLSVLFS
jgi:hypothetical protein